MRAVLSEERRTFGVLNRLLQDIIHVLLSARPLEYLQPVAAVNKEILSCPRSVPESQVLTWIWISSTCRMWITWAAGLPAAAGQSPWRLVCNLARCLGRTKNLENL